MGGLLCRSSLQSLLSLIHAHNSHHYLSTLHCSKKRSIALISNSYDINGINSNTNSNIGSDNSNNDDNAGNNDTNSSIRTIPEMSLQGTVIGYINSPSVVEFYSNYFMTSTPIIMKGCMSHWPAIADSDRCWHDIDNIKKICGMRMVPVETGYTYLAHDAGSKLLTISDFIDTYISTTTTTGSSTMGYLAQHQLLDQIPELSNDIIIPDYCAILNDDIDNDHSDVITNAWFGPIGTVSPLHHDPYYNILAQIVGYKYIRLYNPHQSLYPYPTSSKMSNNSMIDLLNIDYDEYPLLRDAEYIDLVLVPGDMLFIPRHYWHFVMSITYDQAKVILIVLSSLLIALSLSLIGLDA